MSYNKITAGTVGGLLLILGIPALIIWGIVRASKKESDCVSNERGSKMNCLYCHKSIDEDSKFCIYCGKEAKKQFKEIQTEMANKNQPTLSSGRIVNFILDSFFIFILLISISYCFEKLGLKWLEEKNEYIFVIVIFFLYYIFFEFIFCKTPAKYISKTRVVMKDKLRPGLIPIILRTVVRFIPIDFMFFYGQRPVGLHDRLSNSRVIDEVR